jgi:hypothetical protein
LVSKTENIFDTESPTLMDSISPLLIILFFVALAFANCESIRQRKNIRRTKKYRRLSLMIKNLIPFIIFLIFTIIPTLFG